jgi:hypothetical protein
MLVNQRFFALSWIIFAVVACPRSPIVDVEGEGEDGEGEQSEGEGEGEPAEGEGEGESEPAEGEGEEGEGDPAEGEGEECVTGGLPRFEARTPESIAALEGMTYTYSLAIRSDGGDLSSLSALSTGVDFRFDVTNMTSISLPSLMCMGPPVPGEGGGLYIGADSTITSIGGAVAAGSGQHCAEWRGLFVDFIPVPNLPGWAFLARSPLA